MTSTDGLPSPGLMAAVKASGTGSLPRGLATVLLLVLVFCAFVGLRARFYRLAEMPLATDEYYFVTSVHSIVSSGLPALPGGGYYVRALIPQYLTAFFVKFLGENGLAYRLQAVMASLLCLPLLYLCGRQMLRTVPAAALVVLLLLSSWAIEFARFARMYSVFQCIVLLFLLRLGLQLRDRRGLDRWLPVLALGAILSHMLGVLLIPLLLLPLIGSVRGARRVDWLLYVSLTAIPVVVAAVLTQINFRNWGVSEPLPPDVIGSWGTALRFPTFPFVEFGRGPFWSLVLMGLLALGMSGVLLATGTWKRSLRSEDLLCGVLLAAALFHQLVIVSVCLFLLLGRYQIHRKSSSPRYKVVVLLSCIVATGWLATSAVSTEWIASFEGEKVGHLGAWRLTFFGWPDFYSPLFVPWYRELPLLGLLIAGAIAYQLFTKIRRPLPELLANPAILLVYFLTGLALIQSPYNTTRYFFFAYPLGLLTLVLSITELIGRVSAGSKTAASTRTDWLAATAALLMFAATSDFNPRHLMQIGSEAVTFRTGNFAPHAATWYPRFDFASPGWFLDDQIDNRSQDQTVIIDGALPVSHYLQMQHAIFLSRSDERFRIVSRERGTRELWSRQRLLSTTAEIKEFTRDETGLWVVRSVRQNARGFHIDEICKTWASSEITKMIGIDGRLEVVHFDLGGCS